MQHTPLFLTFACIMIVLGTKLSASPGGLPGWRFPVAPATVSARRKVACSTVYALHTIKISLAKGYEVT